MAVQPIKTNECYVHAVNAYLTCPGLANAVESSNVKLMLWFAASSMTLNAASLVPPFVARSCNAHRRGVRCLCGELSAVAMHMPCSNNMVAKSRAAYSDVKVMEVGREQKCRCAARAFKAVHVCHDRNNKQRDETVMRTT